jgi:hypothetical protein
LRALSVKAHLPDVRTPISPRTSRWTYVSHSLLMTHLGLRAVEWAGISCSIPAVVHGWWLSPNGATRMQKGARHDWRARAAAPQDRRRKSGTEVKTTPSETLEGNQLSGRPEAHRLVTPPCRGGSRLWPAVAGFRTSFNHPDAGSSHPHAAANASTCRNASKPHSAWSPFGGQSLTLVRPRAATWPA